MQSIGARPQTKSSVPSGLPTHLYDVLPDSGDIVFSKHVSARNPSAGNTSQVRCMQCRWCQQAKGARQQQRNAPTKITTRSAGGTVPFDDEIAGIPCSTGEMKYVSNTANNMNPWNTRPTATIATKPLRTPSVECACVVAGWDRSDVDADASAGPTCARPRMATANSCQRAPCR